jgi:DNA (cytosine-5)-methyltransferase 1
MRVVEEVRPRAVVLENVGAFAFDGKNEALSLLLRRFREINRAHGTKYDPVYRVLSAASYGVPQLRERFFLVASADGKRFEFPDPTHCSEEEQESEESLLLQPHRTAWDALGNVTPDADEDLEMRGKWARLLPTIPEGMNYLHHTERSEDGGLPLFGWRRRYWSFLLKLAKNRPSWTIQAQPGPATGPFHWDNRLLGHRELCRLQTFPDHVRITGNRAAVQKQVGNAVPSLLAEVIARAVGTQLLGLRTMKAPPSLLLPSLGKPPRPRKPREVPAEYLALVGKHVAHPGTGQGYRAVARVPSAS